MDRLEVHTVNQEKSNVTMPQKPSHHMRAALIEIRQINDKTKTQSRIEVDNFVARCLLR